MASIADIVMGYRSAKNAYEAALSRAADCPDPHETSQRLDVASSAVRAAANAVQAARLAAEAREKLGPEMTELLLESACQAASFASDAARQACGLHRGSAAEDAGTAGEMHAATAVFATPFKAP